jgi:hypothetical protein
MAEVHCADEVPPDEHPTPGNRRYRRSGLAGIVGS